MSKTYEAILHGDRIEWRREAPPIGDAPAGVTVSLRESKPEEPVRPDGAALAEALDKIAEMGFDDIEDPVAWQREQRRGRPLSCRH